MNRHNRRSVTAEEVTGRPQHGRSQKRAARQPLRSKSPAPPLSRSTPSCRRTLLPRSRGLSQRNVAHHDCTPRCRNQTIPHSFFPASVPLSVGGSCGSCAAQRTHATQHATQHECETWQEAQHWHAKHPRTQMIRCRRPCLPSTTLIVSKARGACVGVRNAAQLLLCFALLHAALRCAVPAPLLCCAAMQCAPLSLRA